MWKSKLLFTSSMFHTQRDEIVQYNVYLNIYEYKWTILSWLPDWCKKQYFEFVFEKPMGAKNYSSFRAKKKLFSTPFSTLYYLVKEKAFDK